MVDLHRRVEKRSIVGTGKTADPERIEELQEEWDRFDRVNRRKTRQFHKVLAQALEEETEEEKKPAEGNEEQVAQVADVDELRHRRIAAIFENAFDQLLHNAQNTGIIKAGHLPKK